MALWTPAETDVSGLRLWLDADDATTITQSGGTASQWNDKSGQANHVAQATAANQPTVTASAINSKTALTFDGGDYLTKSGLSGFSDQTMSVFVVGSMGAAGQSFFDVSDNTTTNRSLLLAWRSGSTEMVLRSQNANPAIFTHNSTAVHLWSGTGDESSRTIYRDGTAGTSNSTAQSSITATNLSVGRLFGNIWPLNGKIAEIVIYNSVLSTADRQKVEGYLAHKWGTTANLPSDHPYKSAAPETSGSEVTGTGAGTVSATGSASGTHGVTGTAAGSVTPTGDAAGAHVAPVTGEAAGTIAPTGSASGAHGVAGTAAGSVTVTGDASGTAAGAGEVTGTAAGTIAPTASASGFVAVTGTGAGQVVPIGEASGSGAPMIGGAPTLRRRRDKGPEEEKAERLARIYAELDAAKRAAEGGDMTAASRHVARAESVSKDLAGADDPIVKAVRRHRRNRAIALLLAA